MPAIDVPFLGTLLISATLLAAAYTFAMGLATGRGRPQVLGATRDGAYTTAALVTLGICLLAYAFQTHDFRLGGRAHLP